MRSSYVSSKRPKKTGEEGGDVYTYIYANELSFLIPCMNERQE
jgi:hypothetical protein